MWFQRCNTHEAGQTATLCSARLRAHSPAEAAASAAALASAASPTLSASAASSGVIGFGALSFEEGADPEAQYTGTRAPRRIHF